MYLFQSMNILKCLMYIRMSKFVVLNATFQLIFIFNVKSSLYAFFTFICCLSFIMEHKAMCIGLPGLPYSHLSDSALLILEKFLCYVPSDCILISKAITLRLDPSERCTEGSVISPLLPSAPYASHAVSFQTYYCISYLVMIPQLGAGDCPVLLAPTCCLPASWQEEISPPKQQHH